MTLKLFLVFTATEFFLCLTPGPAVLLVVSQGMKFGARQSLKGTLGILTGNLIYFGLSAAGLGALLLASATLFQMIKWVGAGYLVFLGILLLFSKGEEMKREPEATTGQPSSPSRKLFFQALVTQLANPKAIIFFTALLPQFITTNEQVAWQFFLLGMISIAVEFPVLVSYGWLAERGRRLLPGGRIATLPDRLAGICLIGTGISLASIKK